MIYVGVNGKGAAPSDKTINRMIAIHETPQDVVLVKHTENMFPNGYVVLREDDIAQSIIMREEITTDFKTKQKASKQYSHVKDGAKYSNDTSLTKGAKKYEPK